MVKVLSFGGLLAACMSLTTAPVLAQSAHELSVYGGFQFDSSSDVSGRDGDGNGFDFDADWEGRSGANPYYWGARYVYWPGGDWGGYLDFTHSKLYADDDTRAKAGYDTMEFTDGVNALTVGVQRRFAPVRGFVPYVGFGAGVVIPHVELRRDGEDDGTFGYEYGGLVAEVRAGASYRFAGNWNAFAEYEGNYIGLDVDTDDGGDFSTDVYTNAVNIGVSYSF